MKSLLLRTLCLLLAFQGLRAREQATDSLPKTLIPAPVRVLGPTQIKDPSQMKVPAQPLEVAVDLSQLGESSPEVQVWAEQAARLCREWSPILCAELATPGFVPAKKITLVFVPHQEAPAATSSDRITISADHILKHPEDYGLVIHELVHVVQAYPPSSECGWLTEGIADYIRFYLYEEDPNHGGIRPGKSRYTDSYRTTACFLNYLVENYDGNIVEKWNARMRQGGATQADIDKILAEDPDVKPETRKNLDGLFQDFILNWIKTHPLEI